MVRQQALEHAEGAEEIQGRKVLEIHRPWVHTMNAYKMLPETKASKTLELTSDPKSTPRRNNQLWC